MTYCRPILEYCSPVWSPYKTKDINCIEKVQRTYTRLAFRKIYPGPYTPDYNTRLKIFDLNSLEYRRIERDLVECFKIVRGYSIIPFEAMFAFVPNRSRRGLHRFQLARKGCTQNSVLHSFAFRVVRVWNRIPSSLVEVDSIAGFKRRLAQFDLHTIAEIKF